MLKIYLTGTESSGKTTLAQSLSKHYSCPWVPEYARQYLQERKGEYQFEDLESISSGQLELEQQFVNGSPSKLILDTDQAVLYVWSIHKYGRVAKPIESRLKAQQGALHLLCSPDIAWEADPLRESASERTVLFEKYKDTLNTFHLQYIIIEGQGEDRLNNAIRTIEAFING